MRIGLVCPYSLTLPGGVQGQVLALARALRSAGHSTRVLGPCDGPPPDTGVTPLGNSLPTAANGSVAPIAPDVPCALRTIRAIRDEEFDVLHLHEPLAPGPTVTALFLASLPMIGTFHAAGGSRAYDLLNPPVRWLRRRLDLAFAVSEEAAAMAGGSLGGEYQVVFNGVEIARCAEAQPWPTEGPTVLFVGRHEPRKGLGVLIESLRWLPDDLKVWVVGEGPETDKLCQKTKNDERVEWLGRIDEREKLSRMRGADVFCAPSLRGESFGVVLVEAMAAGTPVVASEIDGYSRVARSGREAVLVMPDDSSALAVALEKVLSDSDLRDELVRNGRERAEEFSMRRLADCYLQAYETVVRNVSRTSGMGLSSEF